MSQPAAIILVQSETAVDGDGSKPQQNLIYVPQLQQTGTAVDGVDSQPQLPNFMYVPQLQQTGTAVNFHGGQHQQPLHVIHVQNPQQPQQPNVIHVQPQQKTVQDLGVFGQYVNKRITKISGDWLIACGFFAIVGAVLEVVGLALQIALIDKYNSFGVRVTSDYSLSSYSGFWCGVLIMASGSVATHSSKNISNCMVITDVVAAVNAIVFAIVLLALTAQQMTGIIDSNNACDSSDDCAVYYPLILSGLSVMVAFSSIALIFGPLLAIFTVIALAKGLCSRNNNIGTA